MRHLTVLTLALMTAAPSWAVGIDEACSDVEKPADYDEQQQQDFLMNYYALGASFSGLHAPIPHDAGRGMIGLRANGLPPLPCRRRFALDHSKTEDTNKSPVLPLLTASYAFKTKWEEVVPYVEGGFLAPIPVAGTRNLAFQAAIGIGFAVGDKGQLGARAHASVQRTIGDIATPIAEGDEVYDDLFLGSTLGVQALGGYELGQVTPYVMVGVIDASTFFYVGDSGIVTNNLHPYLGPEYAVGADALVVKDKLRLGGEYYGAPGGSRTLGDASAEAGFAGYGRIHTIRFRIGLEL